MNKKLLFVVNIDWFFLSHRLPIALAALAQGYEVHVACGLTDKAEALSSYGLIVHPLNIRRGKFSLAAELKLIAQLFTLFQKLQPNLVHLITNKPVIYGGIVARLLRLPAVVAAIPGLGFIFTAQGIKATILQKCVGRLYRIALSSSNLKVIFQNKDDERILKQAAHLNTTQISLIQGGSGVDLNQYFYESVPNGVPLVMMAARLLVDKGVREFVEAASILQQRGLKARFCLVGSPDPGNPTSIRDEEIEEWKRQNLVDLLGYRADIPALFKQAHIVVLPSYREGFPKVLVEAAACGRAVVTTDVPGCRDAIVANLTGLLVPVRDASALATALENLLANPELYKSMGMAGRALAEKEFDVQKVVKTHLKIYQELLLSA